MATLLRRFYDEPLAQASYMLACTRTKEALVVDPNRDAEQYVVAAAEDGVRITHVTETHIHADYVSGVRELAHRTGARAYLSDAGPKEWKYAFAAEEDVVPLRDGSSMKVGELEVRVVHTPGHTPEHLTFIVREPGADASMGAFTGDFVFVGDVGRPDLLERAAGVANTMRDSAAQLYRSLRVFARLPDHLQIWPGHGAGSPCGKALGAVPQSTLGYEKLVNWAFNVKGEDAFVAKVLEGQPEPPRYFAVMKCVNRDGPRILGPAQPLPEIGTAQLRSGADANATILDTRDFTAYAAGHVRGSVNVPLGKQFPLWAGSVVDYDKPVYLVARDRAGAELAARQLRLIGIDDVRGFTTSGGGEATIRRMSAGELRAAGHPPPATQIVDVRNAYEWAAGHIDGATHIPLAAIADRLGELDKSRPVIVHCQGGSRSAVAASLLDAHGFDVANLEGGYGAWQRARASS